MTNYYDSDDADRYDIETMAPCDWDHDGEDDYRPSWDDISGKLFLYDRSKLAKAMERKAKALCDRAKNHDEYCRQYAAWYLRIAPRFGLTEGIKTAEQYTTPGYFDAPQHDDQYVYPADYNR